MGHATGAQASGSKEQSPMDDTVVNRLKNEMVQAIAAAISSDPNVEACRAKARPSAF